MIQILYQSKTPNVLTNFTFSPYSLHYTESFNVQPLFIENIRVCAWNPFIKTKLGILLPNIKRKKKINVKKKKKELQKWVTKMINLKNIKIIGPLEVYDSQEEFADTVTTFLGVWHTEMYSFTIFSPSKLLKTKCT